MKYLKDLLNISAELIFKKSKISRKFRFRNMWQNFLSFQKMQSSKTFSKIKQRKFYVKKSEIFQNFQN